MRLDQKIRQQVRLYRSVDPRGVCTICVHPKDKEALYMQDFGEGVALVADTRARRGEPFIAQSHMRTHA